MNSVSIKGYPRNNGVFGIRNHILVMSGVVCANSVVDRIARTYPDIVAIQHQHGCSHIGADTEQVLRTLAGTCGHPNVGAVLLVGLGCETISVKQIASQIDGNGRRIKTIVIQEIGSIDRIMEEVHQRLGRLREFVAKQERIDCDIADLVVGLECGGSDPFSGITANPTVGLVSDRLVERGATVILSEVPEMIGAELALAPRIPDPTVKQKLFARIQDYINQARDSGCDIRGSNPTPGNVKAGLSSIEEKSLGCIIKGGHTEIREFMGYAERPSQKGLVIMDTPGNDPESLTGMAAGGAHLMLFTTGVGTPLGHPVAPVIKISSNTRLYERMRDFIDIDAGRITRGVEMNLVADELFAFAIEVCNGTQTAAERNGCREFALNRIGPTF